MMKVAVLGSGGGGCAAAFDFAAHGHEVNLFDFPEFKDNIAAAAKNGGITAEGDIKGYAKINYAGHDIRKALEGADLIVAVGPAYSTRPFAEACKPHLKKGMVVIVCPSSCGGSVEFKNGIGKPVRDEDIVVAETNTLPYAVRVIEPAKVHVFLKLRGGLFLAAVPAKNTGKVLGMVRDVYPDMKAAKNIMQTTLQNGNPIIHPAISLCNVGLIERTHGDFYFYEDGVTPAVGRLVEAVDRERVAIARRLGVNVLPDPELGMLQGYQKENNYNTSYSRAPGYRGIKAQSSLDYRYFNEDVGYGLIFMSRLGAQIGVATPHMDSIITLVSTIMQRDYRKEQKRTMETLGLGGKSAEELDKLLA
jgi:opine dehydrogenase